MRGMGVQQSHRRRAVWWGRSTVKAKTASRTHRLLLSHLLLLSSLLSAIVRACGVMDSHLFPSYLESTTHTRGAVAGFGLAGLCEHLEATVDHPCVEALKEVVRQVRRGDLRQVDRCRGYTQTQAKPNLWIDPPVELWPAPRSGFF